MLQMWVKKMCSGRNGGWGNLEGKALVRDQLGVIAQVAAAVAPLWSQPRCRASCGLIPVRKSRKETSLGAWDKGVLVVQARVSLA